MHIVVNALTIHPGGGLTVVLGVVRSLQESAPDWKITVLTSNDQTHTAIESARGTSRVERILPNASAGKLFTWQNFRLGSWLNQNGVDVILNINHYIYNLSCPQIVYHLNLLRFQKPSQRGFGLRAVSDWLRDHAARQAVRSSDLNVFESGYLQDAAETACHCRARNGHVVYIGLPDELIELANRPNETSTSSRRIACITSPAEHKDNQTLIRMLAELVARHPDEPWKLDLAGGSHPDFWIPLRQLAQELNVHDRITWHGFCSQDQLTGILKSALCLVSTSLVESFAMVALEAMARGCPPIVANCASMPESVGNAGLLARPKDPVSFADAVWQLAESPPRRDELVRLSKEWISRFRWKNCGLEFVRLIHDLTAKPQQAKKSA